MFWLSYRPFKALVSTRQSARPLSEGVERLLRTVWPPGGKERQLFQPSLLFNQHISFQSEKSQVLPTWSTLATTNTPAHSWNLWNIYTTGLLDTVSHRKKKKRSSGITPQVALKIWFVKKLRMWSERGPGGLTTQGEPKAKARLSSESRHSQSKLLRNCLNFCKPPPHFEWQD